MLISEIVINKNSMRNNFDSNIVYKKGIEFKCEESEIFKC